MYTLRLRKLLAFLNTVLLCWFSVAKYSKTFGNTIQWGYGRWRSQFLSNKHQLPSPHHPWQIKGKELFLTSTINTKLFLTNHRRTCSICGFHDPRKLSVLSLASLETAVCSVCCSHSIQKPAVLHLAEHDGVAITQIGRRGPLSSKNR